MFHSILAGASVLNSAFTPPKFRGLTAWYNAGALVATAADPATISGLTARYRVSDLAASADPSTLSNLAARYRADATVTTKSPGQISGVTAWYRADSLSTAVADPTAISGLVSWFRADKGITLNGSTVASWTDSAPGADGTHTLTQGTPSRQPTFVASDATYNNKPTLSFVAASIQFLVSSAWTTPLTQPSTVVVIGNDDNSTTQQFFVDGIDGTHRQVIYHSSGNHAISTYAGTDITVGNSSGTPMIVVGSFNGASSTGYLSTNLGIAGNAGTNGLTGLSVGIAYNVSLPLNGKIAEVMVFNRALSQSEVQSLEMYAAQRYGLSISIGTWSDGAGTHTASQATQTAQPTLKLANASYKNQPTLHFTSANTQLLRTAGFALAQPQTIFIVGNCDGSAVNQYFCDGGTVNEIYVSNLIGTRAATLAAGGSAASVGTATASPLIIVGVVNSTNSTLAVSSQLAQASGNIGTNSRSGLTIGAAGSAAAALNGDIAELAIFNGALSQSDIDALTVYAAQRYGINAQVHTWLDELGTDVTHHLSQSVQTQQPTLNVTDAAYNNQPTLSFVSASLQWLSSPAWSSAVNSPYTVVVVGNDDGTNSVQQFYDMQSGSFYQTYVSNNGTGFYNMFNGGVAYSSIIGVSNTPKVFATTPGSQSKFYINSNAPVTGAVSSRALSGLTIGASHANSFALNGKIAEVLVYSRALTQVEVQELEMYAASRYGLTISVGTFFDGVGADNTHILSQSTPSKQPTVNMVDPAYNNQPTLSFASGSSQFLSTPVWTSQVNAPFTVLVVGNMDNTNNEQMFIDTVPGAAVETLIYNNVGRYGLNSAGSAFVSTVVPSTASVGIVGVFNGASSAIYVNGQTFNTTGSLGAGSLLNGLSVGTYQGQSNFFLNGKIAELAVFNRLLTTSEIASLELYAAKRYGLTVSIGLLTDQTAFVDVTHHLSQSIQSQQPTLVISDPAYNNQSSLTFQHALSQFLKSPAWAANLPQPYTVFVVGNSDGGANGYFNQYWVDGNIGNEGLIQSYNVAAPLRWDAYAGTALNETSLNDTGQKAVVCAIFNTTNSSLYINAKTARATGNIGSGIRAGFTLGNYGGVGNYSLNGKITEAIVYNRVLSQAEVEKVLIYLGNKYSIPIGS